MYNILITVKRKTHFDGNIFMITKNKKIKDRERVECTFECIKHIYATFHSILNKYARVQLIKSKNIVNQIIIHNKRYSEMWNEKKKGKKENFCLITHAFPNDIENLFICFFFLLSLSVFAMPYSFASLMSNFHRYS